MDIRSELRAITDTSIDDWGKKVEELVVHYEGLEARSDKLSKIIEIINRGTLLCMTEFYDRDDYTHCTLMSEAAD